MNKRRSRYQTAFGEALADQLHLQRKTQADLAKVLGRTVGYANQTMTGLKPASARWVSMVSEVLKLPPADTAKLYRAAALDNGFKIDLDKE